THTGTNAGDGAGGDGPGSAARIRRQRSKLDRVRPRARQNALTVCPDRFQASIVARQAWTFSGRRLDMTKFSQWGKLTDYPTPQGVISPDTYRVSASTRRKRSSGSGGRRRTIHSSGASSTFG